MFSGDVSMSIVCLLLPEHQLLGQDKDLMKSHTSTTAHMKVHILPLIANSSPALITHSHHPQWSPSPITLTGHPPSLVPSPSLVTHPYPMNLMMSSPHNPNHLSNSSPSLTQTHLPSFQHKFRVWKLRALRERQTCRTQFPQKSTEYANGSWKCNPL